MYMVYLVDLDVGFVLLCSDPFTILGWFRNSQDKILFYKASNTVLKWLQVFWLVFFPRNMLCSYGSNCCHSGQFLDAN